MNKQQFLDNLGIYICSLGVYSFLKYEKSISNYFDDKYTLRRENAFLYCCQSEWFVNSEFFTKHRLERAVYEKPGTALLFAAKYLSIEQLEYCCKIDPTTALQSAEQYLTPELLEYCKSKTTDKI